MWSTALERASWVAGILGLVTTVLYQRAANRATRADQRRIALLLQVIATKMSDEAEVAALLSEATESEQATARWRRQATRWARTTVGVLAVPVFFAAYLGSAFFVAGSEVHVFAPTGGDRPLVEHRPCIGAQDCMREGTISYIWHTDAEVRRFDGTIGADRRKAFHTFLASVVINSHDDCDGARFEWTVRVADTVVASGDRPADIDVKVATDVARIQVTGSRTDSAKCEADLVLRYPTLDYGLSPPFR